MAIVTGLDQQALCEKALGAINFAADNGVLTDTLVNANATVTALIAAMGLQALVAGDSQDSILMMQRGVRMGNLAGAIPETTAVTTVAALRALVSANTPGVSNPTTFHGNSPQ